MTFTAVSNIRSRIVLAVGLTALAAFPAYAAQISYDVMDPSNLNFSNLNTSDTKQGNYSDSLPLPLFNPTLGVLTEVTFTLEGAVYGNAEGENEDPQNPDTITLDLSSTLTATGPNSTSVVSIPLVQDIGTVSANPSGDTTYASPYSVVDDGAFATQTESNNYTDPVTLAAYTGFGTFSFSLMSKGSSTASDTNGDINSQFRTYSGGEITVTYTYDTYTPEPGPMVLIGAALVGLGLLRHKNPVR